MGEVKVEIELENPLDRSMALRGLLPDDQVIVGPPNSEPLLGHVVLEIMDLLVDPLQQKLTPRPESPFLPELKLK